MSNLQGNVSVSRNRIIPNCAPGLHGNKVCPAGRDSDSSNSDVAEMKPSYASNKTQTLSEISLTLRTLVLCVARYAIEQRGGRAYGEPFEFTLTCTGIDRSDEQACRNAVDALFLSLQQTIVFDPQQPSSMISRS